MNKRTLYRRGKRHPWKTIKAANLYSCEKTAEFKLWNTQFPTIQAFSVVLLMLAQSPSCIEVLHELTNVFRHVHRRIAWWPSEHKLTARATEEYRYSELILTHYLLYVLSLGPTMSGVHYWNARFDNVLKLSHDVWARVKKFCKFRQRHYNRYS